MAIGIHIIRVNFVTVNLSTGQFIDKNGDTSNPATISEMLAISNEHRVLPDSGIPNSANYPSVADYLEAEAADNYVLHYMDQNTVVTYEHGAGPLP